MEESSRSFLLISERLSMYSTGYRKMKEMTGLPISEFIRNIRLEQAVRLLKEQKINVTQVAYTVGFSNLAHFSTVFRKQFGVSPTEYIEQNSLDDTKNK